MKLVADEGLERGIVARLRADGHEVTYVAELDPGIADEAVLGLVYHERSVEIFRSQT